MNIPHLKATQGGGTFSIKILLFLYIYNNNNYKERKNGYCRLLLENRLNLFEFRLNLSGFIFNLFGKRLNLSELLIGQS
jgi:hypothetical protein